jgi:hypothetical protein
MYERKERGEVHTAFWVGNRHERDHCENVKQHYKYLQEIGLGGQGLD